MVGDFRGRVLSLRDPSCPPSPLTQLLDNLRPVDLPDSTWKPLPVSLPHFAKLRFRSLLSPNDRKAHMLQLMLLFRVGDLKRERPHVDKHLCACWRGLVVVNVPVPVFA